MLLLRIERLLRHTRMPATRFGRQAVGDPNLVRQLRRGRQLRAATTARVFAYLLQQEKLQ
jgi:2,4-dienoyl-CoA reductase-like NADH-dependent reductase (Old Yellow Enzyme family)